MTKNLEKKINACEMWIWRKMQRISWMEKKTNEEVRLKIGVENDETLQQMAIRRKLGFFGHIMRSQGLKKEMMMACGEGRRKRGRPRKKWMDEIGLHERTGMNLMKFREATMERRQWRRYIMLIARAHGAESTRRQGDLLL